MTELAALARQLVEATARGDAALTPLLHPDARLRLWGWQQSETHRPQARVAGCLAGQWAETGATLEICTVTADAERVVVEYRVQVNAPSGGRCVEHNRVLVATAQDGALHTLDLYCTQPLPSGPHNPPPAPAGLGEPALHRLFEEARFAYDPRAHGLGNRRSDFIDLGLNLSFGDDPHPASGFAGGARWTDAEADARIAAVVERFRAMGHGFQWWVTRYDTPADLPARLERHGLVRAGGYEKMLRRQLADLSDIPFNPELELVLVDGADEAVFQAAMHVITVAFNEPPEHAAQFAAHWRERLQDDDWRSQNVIYLARLNGRPAGTARISLQGTMGYLVAGSTLPEFRGRHVYSSLLRQRLQVAHQRGFNLVALDAGPMSRAVVERYGFEPFGTTHVYAWMPVMDPAVIRALVPNE
ncbi:MAG: GNAT family N-acetyltransferase [Anaerolineales bacterium]|nr:GNAT family N-acetyltransferase [Anaerolineales bacterium]